MQDDLIELNKQATGAALGHMGKVAWPTLALTLIVCSLFVPCLVLFAKGYMSVWLATLITGVLTYMSYTTLHEAVHGNISGSKPSLRWLNALCGYAVAPIIGIAYASHKYEHFTHHRYTNVEDKDPDFGISQMKRGPITSVITIFRFFFSQNLFFVKNNWKSAKLKDRILYCTEVCVSLGWRGLAIVFIDRPGISVVIILGYFIGAWCVGYWFAYRPHFPYDNTERYQNTSSLIMPFWMRPFEWFWFGQNIHSIHHLFPRVPFYRYHALHREIEPILRAHGTPILGIFSRKPIEEAV
ncbi:fatty acid desaturase [Zhongshania borealis]|uniref:Fatty acid desaturase domain-containing protein n=1 Tax=Zhongshania borealis TaxID=889488 RepID=A0ABP7WSA2_9GAMM